MGNRGGKDGAGILVGGGSCGAIGCWQGHSNNSVHLLHEAGLVFGSLDLFVMFLMFSLLFVFSSFLSSQPCLLNLKLLMFLNIPLQRGVQCILLFY